MSSFSIQKNSVYKISRRNLIIAIAFILGVIAILLSVAAFYDYKIDYILAKPALPKYNSTVSGPGAGLGFVYTSDVIARIVEIIGTGPCILATVAALMIFHQNAYRIPNKGLRYIVKIGSVAVALMWVIYACFFQFFPLMIVSFVGVTRYGEISPLDSLGNVKNVDTAVGYLIFGLVMGGLIVTPFWLIFRRIGKQTMAELLRWAFIVTSAGIIAILMVEIAIKPTFQRERFRFLMAYGNVNPNNMNEPTWNSVKDIPSGFWMPDSTHALNSYGDQNWDPNGGFHRWYELPYTPYGWGSKGNLPFISEDSSKSFPSGHETMAAIGFYSLVALPFTVKQCSSKKTRISLFTVAVLGSAIVGFYRIRAGAHYLSDVTIGSFIAVGLLSIFYALYCYGSKHLDRWCNLTINQNRRGA